MDNYDYCAGWVLQQPQARGGRVLDYGCGAGQVVIKLREAGCDAYGCDLFDGTHRSGYASELPSGFLGSTVRRMQDDAIPFDHQFFDIVVNNMVMEHVQNIDVVLDEIARVLKPGGLVLSLFPDRSVWIESHCRIPLLHRFRRGGRARVYYAAFLSSIGIGARHGDEKPLAWSRRICAWLDEWTHYRSRAQVIDAYGRRFAEIRPIEEQWLKARKGSRAALAYRLPVQVQRYFVRRLGALAFVSRKET